MKISSLRKSKGFTLIEMLVAFVLVGVVLIAAAQMINDSKSGSKVDNSVKQIQSLYAGASSWGAAKANYTGLTCATVVPTYTSVIASCTGTNPWGGNYTVVPGSSCTGGNAAQICVTSAGIPTDEGAQLVNQFTGTAAVTPTFAAGTLTVILN